MVRKVFPAIVVAFLVACAFPTSNMPGTPSPEAPVAPASAVPAMATQVSSTPIPSPATLIGPFSSTSTRTASAPPPKAPLPTLSVPTLALTVGVGDLATLPVPTEAVRLVTVILDRFVNMRSDVKEEGDE